jgi:hypothetical protein
MRVLSGRGSGAGDGPWVRKGLEGLGLFGTFGSKKTGAKRSPAKPGFFPQGKNAPIFFLAFVLSAWGKYGRLFLCARWM